MWTEMRKKNISLYLIINEDLILIEHKYSCNSSLFNKIICMFWSTWERFINSVNATTTWKVMLRTWYHWKNEKIYLKQKKNTHFDPCRMEKITQSNSTEQYTKCIFYKKSLSIHWYCNFYEIDFKHALAF